MAVATQLSSCLASRCEPRPRGPMPGDLLINQLGIVSPPGTGGSGGIPNGNDDPGGDSLALGPNPPPTLPPDDSDKSKPSRSRIESKALSVPGSFTNGRESDAHSGSKDAVPDPEPAPVRPAPIPDCPAPLPAPSPAPSKPRPDPDAGTVSKGPDVQDSVGPERGGTNARASTGGRNSSPQDTESVVDRTIALDNGGAPSSPTSSEAETTKPRLPSLPRRRGAPPGRRGGSDLDSVAMFGSGEIRSPFGLLDGSSVKARVSHRRICDAKPRKPSERKGGA